MAIQANRLQVEEFIRDAFNKEHLTECMKRRLTIPGGTAQHEFDIYHEGKIIGGINTSPWRNKSGTNNTGGQDRVSAELLWLSLWAGQERRVLILAGEEMAEKTLKRYRGAPFAFPIDIVHYDLAQSIFKQKGTIGAA